MNAELIDEKLKNLKWITPQYSENTMEEINNINEIKNILIKDNRKNGFEQLFISFSYIRG